jgi:hypothetical protein
VPGGYIEILRLYQYDRTAIGGGLVTRVGTGAVRVSDSE